MVFGQDSGQKKEKRKGPCLWCGERESTQWRIGPSHAPTLCNACGVHWGRKKKLPAHRVPYGNAARLKRERQIFTYVEESDSSESESQAAETLLQLSLSPSSTREKRRQSTAAARRSGSESEPEILAEKGEGNGDTDSSEAEQESGARDAAGDVPAAVSGMALTSTSEGIQSMMSSEAAAARSTAFASVSTSSAAPVVTQSEFNAVMSTLPSTAMLLAGGPAQWPASFALPTAFDVFRVDWNAAHPAAGWSDARRAWETLPQDIVGVYQRRATAALLAPPPCPPPMACSSPELTTSQAPLASTLLRPQQAPACLAN